MLAARHTKREQAWDLERVVSFFPRLKERVNNRGNQLSGGEQQMLSIGRALISNPDFMLMDEPSEGLAPLVIRDIGRIIQQLKEAGFSILLAEQNLPLVLSVADHIYVVNKGIVVFEGTAEELQKNEEVKREYLAL
jgi:branched-chain amino acid transport system ATP-binding protein